MRDMDEYTFDMRVNIVVKFLTDLFIDFVVNNRSLSEDEGKLEFLGLVNEKNEPLFEFDVNYVFSEDSQRILLAALEKVRNELDDYENEGIITDEQRAEMNLFIKFIENVFSYGTSIKTSKVSFMTIPLLDERSVLDNDVEGKPSTIVIGNETFKVSSPHSHTFIGKGIDNKKVAANLLELLNLAEDILKYGDDFTKVARKKGKVKAEDGTYVIRDLDEKIRIQLDRVGDRIIIAGIYYKESKGAKSDKDPVVQDQYEVRKKVFEALRRSDIKTIETGELAYLKFKQKLCEFKYGDRIKQVEEMRKLLVAAVKRKMQNELDGWEV